MARLSRRSVLLALSALVLLGYGTTLSLVRSALSAVGSSTRRHAVTAQHAQPQPPPAGPALGGPTELRRKKRERRVRKCFDERDYGMLPLIRERRRTRCDDNDAHGAAAAVDGEPTSAYTHYDAPRTGLRSTVVTNLWVDLRNARVFKPIQNVSQDGHLHDPRFTHASVDAFCVCNTAQDHSTENGVRVWEFVHGDHPMGADEPWRFCRAINSSHELEALRSGVASEPWNTTLFTNSTFEPTVGVESSATSWPYAVRYIPQNAIIVARRDDHNPFFQLSAALNARIMMQVLNWTPETTQLVFLDDGLPATTDELQRRILAPLHPAITGRQLMGSVVHFTRALVAPFEYSGPLMRHLDDAEPCGRNQLVLDFRDLALAKFGVPKVKRDPTTCTITVISRRPYEGRMVQRKWLNEAAIVERMRLDYESNADFYKLGTCRVRAVDFAGRALEEQMRLVVESDVIIGMHGAGMVNVLWARPDTVVFELFPRQRRRWGYRNLCQFVGCKWHEFRGGMDTGEGDNTSDKLVSYADWFAFIDPILRHAVRALESRAAHALRHTPKEGDEY